MQQSLDKLCYEVELTYGKNNKLIDMLNVSVTAMLYLSRSGPFSVFLIYFSKEHQNAIKNFLNKKFSNPDKLLMHTKYFLTSLINLNFDL